MDQSFAMLEMLQTMLSKSFTGDHHQSLGLLRPHLPPKSQRIIDLFLKIIELNALLNEIFPREEKTHADRYPETL